MELDCLIGLNVDLCRKNYKMILHRHDSFTGMQQLDGVTAGHELLPLHLAGI